MTHYYFRFLLRGKWHEVPIGDKIFGNLPSREFASSLCFVALLPRKDSKFSVSSNQCRVSKLACKGLRTTIFIRRRHFAKMQNDSFKCGSIMRRITEVKNPAEEQMNV